MFSYLVSKEVIKKIETKIVASSLIKPMTIVERDEVNQLKVLEIDDD